MNAVKTMYQDVIRHGSRRLFEAPDIPHLAKVIAGDWSANDLLEFLVDETSTAASVGSGTDRAIGSVSPVFPKDKEEEDMTEVIRTAKRVIELHQIGTDIDLSVHRYLEREMPQRNTREFRKLVLSAIRRLGF